MRARAAAAACLGLLVATAGFGARAEDAKPARRSCARARSSRRCRPDRALEAEADALRKQLNFR